MTEKEKKNRLFSDISAVQVIATALAAVTSMLLSSYIGIAGSVIGVAVASVVSTLAASAYKKFIRDSTEKIKEIPHLRLHNGTDKKGTEGEVSSAPDASPATETSEASGTHETSDAGETPEQHEHAESDETAPASDETAEDTASVAAADEEEHAVAPQTSKRLVRGLIAVCIISALLAVAASAAVVYLLTTGEGLGEKPSIIYMTAPQNSRSDSSTAHDGYASRGSNKDQAADTALPQPPSSSSSSDASSSASSSSSSSSSTTEPGESPGGEENPSENPGGEENPPETPGTGEGSTGEGTTT